MIMKKLLLVPLVLLPAACATTPGAEDGTRDLAYEEAQQAKWNRIRRSRLVPKEIGRVLLDANNLLRDYFESRKAQGNTRVESHIVSTRKALQQLVAANFARIVLAAEDSSYGQNRTVALTSLGFTACTRMGSHPVRSRLLWPTCPGSTRPKTSSIPSPKPIPK